MTEDRPAIPDPMKRTIRQRDGFGCVICGCPIYVCEHFEEYANVSEHTEENIYLLCDHHHRRKGGLLPLQKITEARNTPYNLKNGRTSPEVLEYDGRNCSVVIGKSVFNNCLSDEVRTCSPVVVHNEELVSFRLENGRLLLSVTMCDENGRDVLQIFDNELTINLDNWDVEFVSNSITIRKSRGEIVLELELIPPTRLEIKRMNIFSRRGYSVKLNREGAVEFNHKVDGTMSGYSDNVQYCIVVNSDLAYSRRAALVVDNFFKVAEHG